MAQWCIGQSAVNPRGRPDWELSPPLQEDDPSEGGLGQPLVLGGGTLATEAKLELSFAGYLHQDAVDSFAERRIEPFGIRLKVAGRIAMVHQPAIQPDAPSAAAGAQELDARWREWTEQVSREMQTWRCQHPKATFREIEAALDERWAQVRARMLEDAALVRAHARVGL